MNDENIPINVNPSVFDDKPIGKSNNFVIPEYAGNDQQVEPALTQKLPLSKRLQSKVWKNKIEALDQLFALVKENLQEFTPFQSMVIDFITFNHPLVVSRGLSIVAYYLEGDKSLSLEPKLMIKTLIQKCLISDKADKQAKKLCEDLLFWYMDNGKENILLDELNQSILHKNIKIMGVALQTIASLLNNYGVKRMAGLEKFNKHLGYIAEPAKPLSKSQTIQLYKEVYRWMGAQMWQRFKIHHEVKQEVLKFSKDYQMTPMEIKRGLPKGRMGGNKPTFYVQSEQSENDQEMDVLSKFTSHWVDETLAVQKWKDKKVILQEFIKKIKVNNIMPIRQISHFITLIKRLLSDNNINLLHCGFLVAKNLANGLKKNFRVVGMNVLLSIFNKLKDSKATIVQAAQDTLKAFIGCLNFQDFNEEIKSGLSDKAPNMKFQTLRFLQNFKNKRDQKTKNQMRNYLSKIVQLTDDGNAQVRKQSLDLLCKLKINYGEIWLKDMINGLDDKKKWQILRAKGDLEEEMIEMQEIKPKTKGKVESEVGQEMNFGRETVVQPQKPSINHAPKQIKPQKIVQAVENMTSKETVNNGSKTIANNQAKSIIKETNSNLNQKQIASLKRQKMDSAVNLLESRQKLTVQATPKATIKTLTLQLQYLIPKMSNHLPELKKQSAEHAIRLLEEMPKVNSENDLSSNNGWNQQMMDQFFNVVKHRLTEPYSEVTQLYCRLLIEMTNKNLMHRNKGMRFVVPTIFNRLKEKRQCFNNLFQILVQNNPNYLYNSMLSQMFQEGTQQPVLEYIINHNQQFVTCSQLKNFIGPFLNIICEENVNQGIRNSIEKVLDQMVELCGESYLQMQAKKRKVPGSERYLRKFNIFIDQPMMPAVFNINSRADRLKYDQDNPWPLEVTPALILKLVNDLTLMKQPMTSLAYPMALNQSMIQMLFDFNSEIIGQFSDVLIKWLYWRVCNDSQETIGRLLVFTHRMLSDSACKITDNDFINLMSSIIKVMNRFKNSFDALVGNIMRRLFQIEGRYQQNSFGLLMHVLNDGQTIQAPVDRILMLFTSHYNIQFINQNLVQLLRIPQVLRNQSFMTFLSTRFDKQRLTASGYVQASSKKSKNDPVKSGLKSLLSDMGGPENMISITAEEKIHYLHIFKKMASNQLQAHFVQLNQQLPPSQIAENHMKVIYSIAVAYMHKEIPTINMYSYLMMLSKIFCVQSQIKVDNCLKDLFRIFVYFLIDLDDNNIDNKAEISKLVNKMVLWLLQSSDSRHMMEILFMIIKNAMEKEISVKLQHLMVKCLSRMTLHNSTFMQKMQPNVTYLITETNKLFHKSQFTAELAKGFNSTLKFLLSQTSPTRALSEKLLFDEGIAPTLQNMCKDILSGEAGAERQKKMIVTNEHTVENMGMAGLQAMINIKKRQL